MKIIDSYWEKNNLGISSTEIIINKNDQLDEINDCIQRHSHIDYLVVKIPSTTHQLCQLLKELGFLLAETTIQMSIDLTKYQTPNQLLKLNNRIDYREIKNIQIISSEIEKGIFTTDRIALDQKFGIHTSAHRYINWLTHELTLGNPIYELTYKNRPIGFFAIKEIGTFEYDNYLAGLYLNKDNLGFGFSAITKAIEEIKKRDGLRYTTNISTNNISIFKLYCQLGFIPSKINHVFIRHKK